MGVLLVTLLVSRLPDDVFATTQGFLVGAAAVIFILLALAVFLVPARRALGRLFTFDTPARGVIAMAKPEEWRDLVKPFFSALVCLAVAGVAGLVRAVTGA